MLARMADRLVEFAADLVDSSCPQDEVPKILLRLQRMERSMAGLVPRYTPALGPEGGAE
jgi:hypothetical protein